MLPPHPVVGLVANGGSSDVVEEAKRGEQKHYDLECDDRAAMGSGGCRSGCAAAQFGPTRSIHPRPTPAPAQWSCSRPGGRRKWRQQEGRVRLSWFGFECGAGPGRSRRTRRRHGFDGAGCGGNIFSPCAERHTTKPRCLGARCPPLDPRKDIRVLAYDYHHADLRLTVYSSVRVSRALLMLKSPHFHQRASRYTARHITHRQV